MIFFLNGRGEGIVLAVLRGFATLHRTLSSGSHPLGKQLDYHDKFILKWQRGRDSNPRRLAPYTRSRRAPSTARTPLCV